MTDRTTKAKIAERVRTFREYRGFSQEDVARALGIPRPAVSLIESGERKVDAIELKKLAQLFACSMDDIMGGSTILGVPEEDESVRMVARAAKDLTPQDRTEVLKFAEYLRSRPKP